MSDKKILQESANEQKQGAPRAHRKVLVNVVALCVCLLLAVLVWVFVMNTQETRYVKIVLPENEGVSYTLSVPEVEVEGTVMDLKRLESAKLSLSAKFAQATSGSYTVTEEDLVLPEGVHLTGAWSATLTVAEK